MAIVADLKLALQDLLAAVRSMATDARFEQISSTRAAKTAEYTASMRASYQTISRELWAHSPMNHVRLGVELENGLDKDAIFVCDIDSGRTMEPMMSFGGNDKGFYTTAGAALGWACPQRSE